MGKLNVDGTEIQVLQIEEDDVHFQEVRLLPVHLKHIGGAGSSFQPFLYFPTANSQEISCGSCYIYVVVLCVVFCIYDIHLICSFPKIL